MNEAILMENRTYWSHRAPSYSEVNREELATHQHAVWKQVLTEQISARFPGRTPDQIHVLEIGTGPGFFAILLAEAGYRVTAIDLTPSMLDEARHNAGTDDFGYNKIVVERPQRNERGDVVRKKGKPVADSALRDTENIPLVEDIDT